MLVGIEVPRHILLAGPDIANLNLAVGKGKVVARGVVKRLLQVVVIHLEYVIEQD